MPRRDEDNNVMDRDVRMHRRVARWQCFGQSRRDVGMRGETEETVGMRGETEEAVG